MISKEQIDQIKQQLIDQIEKTFPLTQKEMAKKQILDMNEEQLIDFLKKNNMIKEPAKGDQQSQCVFCSIIEGKIPSHKIDETDEAIAVLELNPISKAHTLIIPKEHIESSDKIPQTMFSFAEEVGKKIKTELKPKDVQVFASNVFGHEILNVLPIYDNETMESQRYKESKEELESLQKKLEKKPEKKKPIKKKKPQKLKEKMLIPRRIP